MTTKELTFEGVTTSDADFQEEQWTTANRMARVIWSRDENLPLVMSPVRLGEKLITVKTVRRRIKYED